MGPLCLSFFSLPDAERQFSLVAQTPGIRAHRPFGSGFCLRGAPFMVQWEGFLLSPGPIQILISQGRYFPMRGCRSLWVGLFKKATKYDFIKGKVNLQGGFVLNPHTPRRPLHPSLFRGCNTGAAYGSFILCVTKDILGLFCSATGRMDFFILEKICKIIP